MEKERNIRHKIWDRRFTASGGVGIGTGYGKATSAGQKIWRAEGNVGIGTKAPSSVILVK